jgi:hypothetical protein
VSAVLREARVVAKLFAPFDDAAKNGYEWRTEPPVFEAD